MIRKLDATLISHIAAGQVIERPASVLKELLENSLDAGAQAITIRIEDGGKTLLEVSDTGCGIAAEELCTAFERHTTSKVSALSDLEKITTFGFRGEALCSIIAAAETHCISRTKEASAGFFVTFTNESMTASGSIAHPPGTVVRVKNLFSLVPARKKFLRSDARELESCLDVFVRTALIHYSCSFRVFIDGELQYDLAATSQLERAVQLTVFFHSEQALPLSFTVGAVHCSGYIGVPQAAGEKGKKQYFSVNARSVDFPQVSKVLKRAYGTLLETRNHPTVILNFSLPQEFVDVNVHPQKTKVTVLNEDVLLTATEQAVKKILSETILQYEHREQLFLKNSKHMDVHLAEVLTEGYIPWHPSSFVPTTEVLQVHRLYLLAECPEGLIAVDQHAAHERILYEEYVGLFKKCIAQKKPHHLEKPIEYPLSPAEFAHSETLISQLENLGVTAQLVQKHLVITTLPFAIDTENSTAFVQELLSTELAAGAHELHTLVHTTCAFLACRHAIKAGDPLTQPERKALLKKLFQTTGQYTCPHGRPVYITFPHSELEKWFHRRV